MLHLRKDCITCLLQEKTTATDEGDNSGKTPEYELKRFAGEVSLWRQERVLRMGSHSPCHPRQSIRPCRKTEVEIESQNKSSSKDIINIGKLLSLMLSSRKGRQSEGLA